ncbi:CBS domain-containing protein [uncultured Winogradskyella sp.]|uniref:CBS domain-containing protein n=1 Tax=uncultured Winogradskyella sp. TaxID=395353 RepID=UPI0030DBA44F|tara:strand:- start:201 stop:620 length:420 start_codon:yes stop_codon:yes gene_type:complete
MKQREPVSAIMSKHLIVLTLKDDLETAEALFKQHKIRHIPVVSGTGIIGMLSYTDVLRISFVDAADEDDKDIDAVVYNMFTIQQVMVKDITTVTSNTSIKDVAKILAKKEFHALPVVDDATLVGIVTTTDLINYLIDLY